MPVLSPSRASSLSGSYRSTLSSSSSLDGPYYGSSSSSTTSSYLGPRSTVRSSYSTSTRSTSYSSSGGEYRSHRISSYDGDALRERKTSSVSEYSATRRGRAPSISDSTDSAYASRSERSGSRSRDASISRSNDSKPAPKPYVSSSTREFYDKYSVSNYVPLSQRLASVSDSSARSRITDSLTTTSYRPPPVRRTVAGASSGSSNERQPKALTSADKIRMTSTLIPRAKVQASWNSDRKKAAVVATTAREADDNGNDLQQLSVSDIKRRFDGRMTVTKLPAQRETPPVTESLYGKTSGYLNGTSLSHDDDKPVPVHKPKASDRYVNGTSNGSLKWDLSSSSSSSSTLSADTKSDAGDVATAVYAKGQSNANNVPKTVDKPPTTSIYIGDANNSNDDKNRISIEVGKENRTSDFASYIQVSAPTTNTTIKDRTNGDSCEEPTKCEEPKSSKTSAVHLLSPDEGVPKLRYIDSEPSLDYNAKDDDYSCENGFENKTFEHANGLLIGSSPPKLNGIAKIVDGVSSASSSSSSDDDNNLDECNNSSDRYASKYNRGGGGGEVVNGEASSSLHQSYQNESLATVKNSSPVNTISNSNTCGSLTTSRRRSIDSKSPQSFGSDGFSKSSGLNGLRNIGNTCFMNSVVQCLSNTKPLLEYCGNPDQFTPHINTTLSCMKGALIKAFSTVITELWKADETDGVVNTTSLKSQIQRFAPRFMGYSQQDAQEFLRYLLEGLHEDVNKVTVKPKPILTEIDENLSDAQKAEESWQRLLRFEDSKVGDIFVGQLKSSLRCTHCSHTSVTFDPFWDLSLPIPSRTGQLKLTQCLSHFTREEELDGDEKPTCSKCQVRRKCLKWFTVQKFPRVLVIHLKRFSPTERFRGKLNVSVEFPLTGLDMTPYAATTNRGPPPPPAIYNLYAVSNHSGTTYSGHYTAYCKHPYNGEWHEYNDSRVSPISPKNVVSSEAYVLFYELAGGSASS